VKGFSSTTSLDDMYAFFEPYGKVLQIFMRRFPTTKQFKGSVFVTFETNEQMKSFMALEEVKSQDVVLIRETQSVFLFFC
jgi:RNA recognition motif-containing protein